MTKYKVFTTYTGVCEYIVEAENAQEAEDNFADQFTSFRDVHDFNIDAQEEVFKVEEVQKDICTFNACKNNAYDGYDICKKHYKDGIND